MVPGHEERLSARPTGFQRTHTVSLVDAEDFSEALLEVVGQEAVEQGIGAGVDVGEGDLEEVDPRHQAGLGDGGHLVHHVGDEEWEPAEHKHHNNDHHHARDLAFRAPAPRQAGPRPR